MLELGTDADDLLDDLDRIGILGVETGDEGVGLARLDHHHAEVVALEHLVVGLLEGVALALALLGQDAGVALATLLLGGMAQVDNLDALNVQVELGSQLGNDLVVAQQHGLADAFGLGLDGGFQHGGVYGLGKDDALRVGSCCGIELLGELGLLAQQHAERLLVGIPVVNMLAGHAALDGGTGHGRRDLGDESRVDGLGNEVVAAEGQVIDLVDVVHHVGYGLLGQVGNGVDGGQLHLLVDGRSMYVQCATEDVGEADDVVDLVGIVGTTR